MNPKDHVYFSSLLFKWWWWWWNCLFQCALKNYIPGLVNRSKTGDCRQTLLSEFECELTDTLLYYRISSSASETKLGRKFGQISCFCCKWNFDEKQWRTRYDWSTVVSYMWIHSMRAHCVAQLSTMIDWCPTIEWMAITDKSNNSHYGQLFFCQNQSVSNSARQLVTRPCTADSVTSSQPRYVVAGERWFVCETGILHWCSGVVTRQAWGRGAPAPWSLRMHANFAELTPDGFHFWMTLSPRTSEPVRHAPVPPSPPGAKFWRRQCMDAKPRLILRILLYWISFIHHIRPHSKEKKNLSDLTNDNVSNIIFLCPFYRLLVLVLLAPARQYDSGNSSGRVCVCVCLSVCSVRDLSLKALTYKVHLGTSKEHLDHVPLSRSSDKGQGHRNKRRA